MNIKDYSYINNWLEQDLINIPQYETDEYEYKSSLAKPEELKDKIIIAASAFWNSGGGLLIIGVDNAGKIDGGINKLVGKENITDWIEKSVHKVEPTGPYFIKLIDNVEKSSLISKDKVVATIVFGESFLGPHMAYDKKYYIRAGACSSPASHFLVEAIRARRGLEEPLLRGVLRFSQRDTNIIELVITSINDATALDVEVSFDPPTKSFHKFFEDKFPLRIPLINKFNPFIMDISIFPGGKQVFGEKAVYLILKYKNITERTFEDKQLLDPSKSLGPMKIGSDTLKEIKKELGKISNTLRTFKKNETNY